MPLMHKTKRIGIDVDEVLRQFIKPLIELYKKYYPNKWYHSFEEINTYDLSNHFEIKQEIYNFFNEQVPKEIFLSAPPYPGASEFTKEIHKRGYTVCIVTRQIRYNEIYTIEWLNKNDIYFDEVHFVKNKGYVITDMFFDDSAENLHKILKANTLHCSYYTIPVIFDRPWNTANNNTVWYKKWEGYRAKDFNEALYLIDNLLWYEDGNISD